MSWLVGGVNRHNSERRPPIRTCPTKFGIFNDFMANFYFSYGGHLGWQAVSSDITLKGDLDPRTTPAKFGPDWPGGFRED